MLCQAARGGAVSDRCLARQPGPRVRTVGTLRPPPEFAPTCPRAERARSAPPTAPARAQIRPSGTAFARQPWGDRPAQRIGSWVEQRANAPRSLPRDRTLRGRPGCGLDVPTRGSRHVAVLRGKIGRTATRVQAHGAASPFSDSCGECREQGSRGLRCRRQGQARLRSRSPAAKGQNQAQRCVSRWRKGVRGGVLGSWRLAARMCFPRLEESSPDAHSSLPSGAFCSRRDPRICQFSNDGPCFPWLAPSPRAAARTPAPAPGKGLEHVPAVCAVWDSSPRRLGRLPRGSRGSGRHRPPFVPLLRRGRPGGAVAILHRQLERRDRSPAASRAALPGSCRTRALRRSYLRSRSSCATLRWATSSRHGSCARWVLPPNPPRARRRSRPVRARTALSARVSHHPGASKAALEDMVRLHAAPRCIERPGDDCAPLPALPASRGPTGLDFEGACDALAVRVAGWPCVGHTGRRHLPAWLYSIPRRAVARPHCARRQRLWQQHHLRAAVDDDAARGRRAGRRRLPGWRRVCCVRPQHARAAHSALRGAAQRRLRDSVRPALRGAGPGQSAVGHGCQVPAHGARDGGTGPGRCPPRGRAAGARLRHWEGARAGLHAVLRAAMRACRMAGD